MLHLFSDRFCSPEPRYLFRMWWMKELRRTTNKSDNPRPLLVQNLGAVMKRTVLLTTSYSHALGTFKEHMWHWESEAWLAWKGPQKATNTASALTVATQESFAMPSEYCLWWRHCPTGQGAAEEEQGSFAQKRGVRIATTWLIPDRGSKYRHHQLHFLCKYFLMLNPSTKG